MTLPTYNEAENIATMIQKLRSIGCEVLVADDNSPDGTWKIVQDFAEKDTKVHLLRRMEKKGRGFAGAEAFAKAVLMGAQYIVEMDADRSHRPEDVPKLLKALDDGAQVVIGSRFIPGGQDTRDSYLRILLTKFSSAYARFFLNIPFADPNSGFRAFKAEVFDKIDPGSIQSPGPGIVHEVLYKAHLAGLKIVEVPIVFIDRIAGESELTFSRLLAGFKNILDLRKKHRIGSI